MAGHPEAVQKPSSETSQLIASAPSLGDFPIADDSLTTLSGLVCEPSLFAKAGMELGGQSRHRPGAWRYLAATTGLT